jgi:Rieske Fe-S protein
MERRDFLKKSCTLCIGGSLLVSYLESCSNIPIYHTKSEDKNLKVPLDQFRKNNFLIVRPEDKRYDIAVIKNSQTEYKSFVMVCTHADNMLRFNGDEFSCNLHGSIFDINGNVQKGPAEKSLNSLNTKIENNFLVIKIN